MNNKYIKPIFFIITLILMLTLFSSCKKDQSNDIYFPQKNDSNVAAESEFAYAAENFEQLYEYADTVVIGNIIDEGEISPEYYYKTVSATLEITECIKGDVAKGEQITVAEFGVRNEDGTDYSIGGVPLLRTGMKVLLFLSQPMELYENSTEYIQAPFNAYQGKFFYDNNGVIHPSTDFATSNVLELSDFEGSMKEAEVLTNINKVAESSLKTE